MKRVVLVAALLTILVSAGLAASRSADATAATHHRCGYMGTGSDRSGLYVLEGNVTCQTAKRLISQMSQAAVPVWASMDLYQSGWVCGGQMGTYVCSWPGKFVLDLLCDSAANQTGCPDLTTYRAFAYQAKVVNGCPARVLLSGAAYELDIMAMSHVGCNTARTEVFLQGENRNVKGFRCWVLKPGKRFIEGATECARGRSVVIYAGE